MAKKKAPAASEAPAKSDWIVHPFAVEPSPLDMKPSAGQTVVRVSRAAAGTDSFANTLVAIAREATREAAKAHIKAGRLARVAHAKS